MDDIMSHKNMNYEHYFMKDVSKIINSVVYGFTNWWDIYKKDYNENTMKNDFLYIIKYIFQKYNSYVEKEVQYFLDDEEIVDNIIIDIYYEGDDEDDSTILDESEDIDIVVDGDEDVDEEDDDTILL